MKRLVWLGDSLYRLREFASEARHEAGYQLERVQAGKEPADAKDRTDGYRAGAQKIHGAY